MKKTRLYLIFHGRFPSEKAASLFAARSADAFVAAGMPVELVVPRRIRRAKASSREYYGIEHDIPVLAVPTIDLFHTPIIRRVAFRISLLAFSVASWFMLHARLRAEDIVYTNEILPAYILSFTHANITYELHDFPERMHAMYGHMLRRMKRVVVTNGWKRTALEERFGIPADRIVLETNAVDTAQFTPQDKRAVRAALGLSIDHFLAVYTGHLYGWKGVDTLVRAARQLPDVAFCLVGGSPEEIAAFTTANPRPENVRFIGHVPHAVVPLWQAAADVLVLPNTAKEDISAYYTSPMKLFEYMASERPIIASDIPSIREIVDEQSVFFARADDPDSFAKVIRSALGDPNAQARARHARQCVHEHTWVKRASRILASIAV